MITQDIAAKMAPSRLPKWNPLVDKITMSSFDSWTEGEFFFVPSKDYTEKVALSKYGDLDYDPLPVLDHPPLAASHCTNRPIAHFVFSNETSWRRRPWFSEMVNEEGCTVLDAVQALTTGNAFGLVPTIGTHRLADRHRRNPSYHSANDVDKSLPGRRNIHLAHEEASKFVRHDHTRRLPADGQ